MTGQGSRGGRRKATGFRLEARVWHLWSPTHQTPHTVSPLLFRPEFALYPATS